MLVSAKVPYQGVPVPFAQFFKPPNSSKPSSFGITVPSTRHRSLDLWLVLVAGGRSEFLSFSEHISLLWWQGSKTKLCWNKTHKKTNKFCCFLSIWVNIKWGKSCFFLLDLIFLFRQIHQSKDHFRKANIFIWICRKLEISCCFSFIRISFPSLHHYRLATGGDLLTIADHSWKYSDGMASWVAHERFLKKNPHLEGWRWSKMKNLSKM